jgi:hypothetical protein
MVNKSNIMAQLGPRVGDVICLNEEEGIVCSLEPLIMKTRPHRSYVPILDWNAAKVVTHDDAEDCSIRDAVKQRIVAYLESRAPEATGDR